MASTISLLLAPQSHGFQIPPSLSTLLGGRPQHPISWRGPTGSKQKELGVEGHARVEPLQHKKPPQSTTTSGLSPLQRLKDKDQGEWGAMAGEDGTLVPAPPC